MDENPYQSPQEIRELRPPAGPVGKRILFWTLVILGLPLALITAGSSICFGFFGATLVGDSSMGGLGPVLLVVAIVLAAVFGLLAWGWWKALKRLKKLTAPAAEEKLDDEKDAGGNE